jgi:hypothetical protein
MEQWSLAGSAILSRIIPVLQHSNTPVLQHSAGVLLAHCLLITLVFAFRPMFGF